MKKIDVTVVTSPEGREESKDEEVLMSALRARGLAAALVDWTDTSWDWRETSVALLRSTWGYTRTFDGFMAWCERVSGVTTLLNPLSVVKWNADKRYLAELDRAGIPIVPTVWVERGSKGDWNDLATERGWDEVIIKPAVSASAINTFRFRTGDVAGRATMDRLSGAYDMMVQPFQGSVVSEGEYSLMFVGGEYTHAVLKRPLRGDFRCQEIYGGGVALVDAPPECLVTGRRAADYCGPDLVYARVDLLASPEGHYQVAELELIEPELFLRLRPESAALMARSVADLLGSRP